MKDYNKTDYAINKMNGNAIVYKFADGSIKTITVDDFGGDMEEFSKWKKLSDNDYHKEDNTDCNISKKEIHIEIAEYSEKYSTPSMEEDYVCKEEAEELSSEMQDFVSTLTEVEKRRLFLLAFKGKNRSEIAKSEGVHVTSVCETFTNIEKKLKKFSKSPLKNSNFETLGERVKFYNRKKDQ